MLTLVLLEIRAVPAERSRGRHNPRVVKRKMSNVPTRSRAAPSTGRRRHYPEHIRVLPPISSTPPAIAPSELEPISTAVAPASKRKAGRPARNPDHRRHVQAWHASGLSRADDCRQHGLDQSAFHHWVAHLRHSFRRKPRKDAHNA